MTAKTFRIINRVLHLLAAGVIGTFVYSPWGQDPGFRLATQAVVIPLLAVSGLMLWKQAAAMRLLGLRRGAQAHGSS